MLVSYVHIVLILNAPSSQKSILERTITDCMFNYMFINIISPVSCNLLYEICFTFLFLKILLKLITVTLSAQDARNPTNVLSYLSSQNLTQPSQFLHSLFYSKLRILLYIDITCYIHGNIVPRIIIKLPTDVYISSSSAVSIDVVELHHSTLISFMFTVVNNHQY